MVFNETIRYIFEHDADKKIEDCYYFAYLESLFMCSCAITMLNLSASAFYYPLSLGAILGCSGWTIKNDRKIGITSALTTNAIFASSCLSKLIDAKNKFFPAAMSILSVFSTAFFARALNREINKIDDSNTQMQSSKLELKK